MGSHSTQKEDGMEIKHWSIKSVGCQGKLTEIYNGVHSQPLVGCVVVLMELDAGKIDNNENSSKLQMENGN